MLAAWLGTSDPVGYGHVSIHGRPHNSHRIAYIIEYGEIDLTLNVCHKCDFTPCCRPTYLFLGTDSENFQDSIRKGRRPPENYMYNNNKIDISLAEKIRELYKAGGISQYELADMFGLRQPEISRIVNNKRW